LGLGELGSAAASALANLGFKVTGWSRRARDVQGVRCLAGLESLPEVLADTEILVLLLPETPLTIDMLDAEKLAMLPKGCSIINAGRGSVVDDDALLAALDSGHLKQATLDVFRTEPLPLDHPFWSHPAITISPHIAAATRVVSAASVIATNIERAEAGFPLLHLVDRARRY
jgi:glyoxylate/hydroxypyruvate reductase A